MMNRYASHARHLLLAGLLFLAAPPRPAPAEVMLQYFNTSWRELTAKLPELAEVGYDALWLPPPTKGSGALSVGYDCWDPFDLGGRDQRGTVRTRYGTEADLLRLIETAHRFGIRVYVDNIMNHRAFDVPGYNEYTPIGLYPGMLPEDFHLRTTEDGFYRKWDNVANWGDTWQIQNRNFSDLIDIAQESPDNGNFGASEGSHVPKIRFVRHPANPEFYCFRPSPTGAVYVGFGTTNITAAMLTDPANAWLYEEDVNAYLIRAARWLVDRTRIDGLRLDAVKHVPDYFFGMQTGAGKDASSAGYCGQAQEQFNLTRGYSDWGNHRDTVFDTSQPRDDLMMFGEHLGQPPGYGGYIDAGMRLVDNALHGYLNGNLGSPWGSLSGLQYAGGQGFSSGGGVMYAKSHDDDYAVRPELHYALILTREGLPNIYTDGNYQAETLGESGGAFPRHANTAFLGQWGDGRIPNLVYIHNHLARGTQTARCGDADVAAYDRVDKREKSSMSNADGAVLFFVMNDNYAAGEYREIPTWFPAGAKLWQYSSAGGNWYYTVQPDTSGNGNGMIKVITPPGGYFAFSWRSPEESDLWSGSGGRPITIHENGRPAGWVSYERQDGPDGDPAFNPPGVADADKTDFTYTTYVPRVSSATNLRFVVRVDGSAKNVLLKLDGGMDLNGTAHAQGDPRDNPPALSTDVFLGYEQAAFVERQYREKFAARDTATRNVIGSAGAETYCHTTGVAGLTVINGVAGRDSDERTARWVFHDPEQTNDRGERHVWPRPEDAAGSDITLWVKVGYRSDVNRLFAYYTTNGASWPEGAGGEGRDETRVAELTFDHADATDNTIDWWTGRIPAQAAGTVLRYKIGAFRQQNGTGVPWDVPFPNDDYSIANKKSMLGVWQIAGFNAATAAYRPHADYGPVATGLPEGFHVLRARAFLERDNRASIYNTFVQPFYLDTRAPEGEIRYPGENATLQGNRYGVVVRTDPTVSRVWYHIEDAEANNDDGQTGRTLGNGTNAAGQWAWVAVPEVAASLSVQSAYPNEWRFNYVNIPAGARDATLYVKLAEVSSATNPLLSDVEGHFTTLVRHVRTDGPDYRLFVAWPQRDGDRVWDGYVMKAWFSQSLAQDIGESELRNRFLVTIDGEAQGRDGYSFQWNVDDAYHALKLTLPDLYNGDPGFQHTISVVHTNAGGNGVTLEADRVVLAERTATGPYVDIVYPPEFDSDGKPFEIVLPETASPAPEDRQVAIRVETGLDARQCWIAFTNGTTGTAVPYASTTHALAGRVAVTAGTNAVAGQEWTIRGSVSISSTSTALHGTATFFTADLAEGNRLRAGTNTLVVTQVVSAVLAHLSEPWPGPSLTNVAAAVAPAFDAELSVGDRIQAGGQFGTVATIAGASNLLLAAPYPGATAAGLQAYRIDGNPYTVGDHLIWQFLWSNVAEGTYRFAALVDTDGNAATVEGTAVRNVTVLLRETVDGNESDDDDDDDGLYDSDESTPVRLPTSNAETWRNGDVHVWEIYGRTVPTLPDTDGDALPDGLELGWRVPIDPLQTDTNADTNGDGFPNFRADLDPPFYNTVPDNSALPNYVFNDSRTKRIHGSLTDPNNPDSDYDGLPDGIEDRNRNGWADGDGKALQPRTPNPLADRPNEADWPDGKWDAGWAAAAGRETDPNKADTDEDGASDGYGEDRDFNGRIAGDANTNRIREAAERWSETDPLNPDTDGDGMPDGWETRYGLDPLEDGVPGHTNMTSGAVVTNTLNGAAGNPDGDKLVVAGVTNEYTNLMEYQNGTNPRVPDTGEPPPEGTITVGPGPAIGVVAGMTRYQEFMDWTRDDCLVLDEYEGAGNNNQGGDLYLGWDGWDSSRDIVAFYAHDGGDEGNGGDGRFYFRVDFHDLQAHAEEGNLDLYVVIDTGNPSQGEMNLPDDVDTITWNRWEAVVAVYQSNRGRVYVDTARDAGQNSTTWGQDLGSRGVVARDETAANGFVAAYYNSDLDAVEFSISRRALIDAGWNGLNAAGFNYQVFTTKDGTANAPVGPGDIGGRSDVRDAIYNDYIAEDYWQSQQGLESILKYWIPGTSRPGRAKVACLLHGNQAIQPGNAVQDLVNTGSGAGYYRPLDAHAVYRQPLSLHVTPTLASAIEWAAADPARGVPWRDGPALNRRIAALAATNLVDLLGSTFSDHILPYFTHDFNRDNESLARAYLGAIYGTAVDRDRAVFWPPERVLEKRAAGDNTFGKILDMGYRWSVIDQESHLFNWFGRTESLIDNAYRVNAIGGVKCFVIDNLASTYLFANTDSGLPAALRGLLTRKAMSGTQDQVVTLFSNWEAFTDKGDADAYDANVRWLANHPWIALVTLEQIAAGEVDAWGDERGDVWGTVTRNDADLSKQGHNWLNYATGGNYDNWYMGSGTEESLNGKRFALRPGTEMPAAYGMLYTTGVVKQAWQTVAALRHADVAELARATLHASVFETAFHGEQDTDLRRYSNGRYMFPATSSNSLAVFARHAQSQSRVACVYAAVDDWLDAAPGLATTVRTTRDVDLDGEAEYLLYNDRLLCVFERSGGRMTGAWARDVLGGGAVQVVGNPVGYPGSETEEEGSANALADGSVAAHRTSALKDWFVQITPTYGTSQYVNQLYTFSSVGNGWRIAATPDEAIVKTVTLAPRAARVEVQYALSGSLAGKTAYVRCGFSPHLADLLKRGQATLRRESVAGGVVALANTNYSRTAVVRLGYADAGHSAALNPAAVDDDPGLGVQFDTLNMRNQAQTQQVEVYGAGAFSFALGFETGASDWDADGMPNEWENGFAFLDPSNPADAGADADGDGARNADEYVAGTSPDDGRDVLAVDALAAPAAGFVVRFAAKAQREYSIHYANGGMLPAPAWSNATPLPITVGSDRTYEWLDDGTATAPAPAESTNRFYRVGVRLPQ